MTIREIAEWLQGEPVGPAGSVGTPIDRVAKIEEATAGSLTFLSNPKYQKFLGSTKASAVLVSRSQELPAASSVVFIRVDDPYLAFLQVLRRLTPEIDPFTTGIHPTAVIAPTATVAADASIGAQAVIGDGASVGARTKIGHGCIVGPAAVIGDDCRIYPRVTIYQGCRVGSRVVLHAGCVIGADGFGFAPRKDGSYEKIPQLGIVVIEDDVEIGANTTVDRATMGETHIGRGVKIDNLVQVAHNVVIGEHTVIAAQTGISGSTRIGKHCMIAGQVGLAGHLEIADRTVLLAQSGIPKSITEPGKTYFGYPAKEARLAQRLEAAIRMLPETMRDLQQLQRTVEELQKKLSER